ARAYFTSGRLAAAGSSSESRRDASRKSSTRIASTHPPGGSAGGGATLGALRGGSDAFAAGGDPLAAGRVHATTKSARHATRGMVLNTSEGKEPSDQRNMSARRLPG